MAIALIPMSHPIFFNYSGVQNEVDENDQETSTSRLHPHRTDDRRCHYRYSGGSGNSAYSDYTVKAKIANAMGAIDAQKTAVALCAQEAGGVLTACTDGAPGIPAFTTTKEVLSATVTGGTIVETLQANLGSGVDSKTITFTPTLAAGGSSLTWQTTTTVTNTAGLAAITKNNITP